MPVFLNVRRQPITRFGIHTLVERTVAKAASSAPSLRKKKISPHTIRHTTAVALLRAGVDINTIRAWLGHVSLETTNRYAHLASDPVKQGVVALRQQHVGFPQVIDDLLDRETLLRHLRLPSSRIQMPFSNSAYGSG